MDFKIINTESTYPDVLLYRYRKSNGKEIVRILAIGTIEEVENMFACEKVTFSNPDLAKNFISDFTVSSANEFCKRNKIYY